MFKWFTTLLCILVCSWILAGCGNKGELFLPSDPRLAEELDAASERIDEFDADTADEDEPDKKKRDTEQPSK